MEELEFFEELAQHQEEAITWGRGDEEDESTPQVLPYNSTPLDTWQQDIQQKNGIPLATYAYYLDSATLVGSPGSVGAWVPPVDSVFSVVATPFMKSSDYQLIPGIRFDTRRFPIGNVEDGSNVQVKVRNVNRIIQQENSDVLVLKVRPYPHVLGKNLGGTRRWQNEGKLWQSPYCTHIFSDGLMEGLEMMPHALQLRVANSGVSEVSIRMKAPLTPSGTYQYYMQGYLGDNDGLMYGAQNNASPQLPIASSVYTSYMSQNRAQMNAQLKTSQMNKNWSIGKSIASLDIGFIGTTMQAGMDHEALIRQQNALERDLSNVPYKLSSPGNDGLFDLVRMANGGQTGTFKSFFTTIMPTYAQLAQIGDYFALYGYAQKKIHSDLDVKCRNRKYYNYIKTVGANIQNIDGRSIPKAHYEKIKSIFDNGTTIWHIDRAGVNVGDYSMDNVEI